MGERTKRDEFIEYCMKKPAATGDYPFDETTLVIRVGGKIFALLDTAKEKPTANLKCEPALARDLRAAYSAIRPGFHMNKEHWNTIDLDGTLPEGLLTSLTDLSYDLVARSLSRAEQERAGLPAKAPKNPPIDISFNRTAGRRSDR